MNYTRTRSLACAFALFALLSACESDPAVDFDADADVEDTEVDPELDPDEKEPEPATPETLTLMASEESSVTARYPDANYDGEPLLVERGPLLSAHAYIKFDLDSIPEGAVIKSAKLEPFYCLCDGIDDIGVFKAAATWSAATLTWSNRPGTSTKAPIDSVNLNPDFDNDYQCGDLDSYVADEGGSADKAGWYVTEAVQEWVSDGGSHGFVLRPTPTLGSPETQGAMAAFFGHSEVATPCGEKPARLIVTYQLP